MNNRIITTAILSGIVFTAGAAYAENHTGRVGFLTLDRDGSGGLTLEELQAHAEARFTRLDADGSGGVTADELVAAARARADDRAARMIARLDDDGDGILQMDEMPRRVGGDDDRAARMFDRVDANQDGEISQDEFQQAREKRGGQRRDRG